MQRCLPQTCALCAARSGDKQLCAECVRFLPATREPCPICALPSPGALVCGACLKRPPPYASTIAAWVYAYPVDRLIHALKYGGRLSLADPLADALAGAVRSQVRALPDAIVAMPLAVSRQRERGFNQAQELARRVSHFTAIPLAGGLARVVDGPPQAALAWNARARNVRHAFVADDSLRGRSIAIVDDVMTTGATLAAATRAAIHAGAKRVDAWVVARTPPP